MVYNYSLHCVTFHEVTFEKIIVKYDASCQIRVHSKMTNHNGYRVAMQAGVGYKTSINGDGVLTRSLSWRHILRHTGCEYQSWPGT